MPPRPAVVAAPEPVETAPEVTSGVAEPAPEPAPEPETDAASDEAEATAEPEGAEPVPAEPGVAAPVTDAPPPADMASAASSAAPKQPDMEDVPEVVEAPSAEADVAEAQPEAPIQAENPDTMAKTTEPEAAPEVTATPVLTAPLVTLPQPSFDAALLESGPDAPAPAAPAAPAPTAPAPAAPAPAASAVEPLPTPPVVPEPAPPPEVAEAPAEPAAESPVETETAEASVETEAAVEPTPDAPPPVEPLPEIAQIDPPETPEAAAPDQATPPDAETVRLPGTQAPAMPGTRPETLPGTVVTVDPPETEVAAAEPAAPGVVTNRLPRIGDDPMTAEAADPAATADPALPAVDPRPVARFAAPFDNPGDRPLLAVVLIDSGAPDLDRAALAALPFPVSIALDPMDTASAEHAAMYRQAGKEVVMLATGVAEGAQASDIEVAFQAMSQGLPEAVAVMELADPAFQDNRPLASIVVPVVQGEGRGLLTWDRGLNAADQVARRDGVPAATVFRDISEAAGDKFGMRRLMDRAMFKADQDGSATVVGEATPDLTATLLEWTLEGRGAPVTLAPLSAVLTVN